MDLRKVDIGNVVGTVIVCNLSTCPIEAIDTKFCAWLECFHHANVRVPTIVGLYRGFFR
jgi:hypothetical protein